MLLQALPDRANRDHPVPRDLSFTNIACVASQPQSKIHETGCFCNKDWLLCRHGVSDLLSHRLDNISLRLAHRICAFGGWILYRPSGNVQDHLAATVHEADPLLHATVGLVMKRWMGRIKIKRKRKQYNPLSETPGRTDHVLSCFPGRSAALHATRASMQTSDWVRGRSLFYGN